MVKKIFTFLLFALIINIDSFSAEGNKANDPESSQTKNLTFRLERLYKLYTEEKEYSQLARKSDIELIQDRVVVAVLAKPGLTTADIDDNNLKSFGARIQAKAGHSMRVEIPIGELVNVATALEGLAEITLPLKPVLDETSEGVALMNADNWQDWGYDGTGVKIAVIDAGFDELSDAQTNGDIPSSYDSCNFTGSGFQATTNHGTAVTEAIFDLAPNAEFYLYKIADNIDFEMAVDSCDSNDVDIINHSMSWVNAYGYYNGTGAICAIVDTALSHGRIWVNSAGNYAQQHYRAQFNGGGPGSYHIFDPPDDTINPTGPYGDGTQVIIALNWDDYPGTNQDYDLYLMQDTGNVTTKWVLVDSSVDNQLGASDPPQEMIIYTNPDAGAMYGVLVKNTQAAGNADFTIFSLNGGLDYYVDSSSIADPGSVTDVVTVGAINRLVYNTTGAIEYFSSQGPTNDGRIKPDVAAPDYCDSYSKGHWYGTSLSSPHTAGVCALIKSRFPSFSDAEIRAFLYNNCTVDLATPGKDNIYGYGKVVMENLDITVTLPNGGENWYIDSTNNITWTSDTTSGGVKIEYSSDNGASWSELIASMPDTGAYPWVIPNTPSDTCLVRITDTLGSPCDTSDAVFEISEPIPEITVTSPNGGEFWYIDSTNNITWTSFATSRGVQIAYSTNNGSSWLNVIASMPDTGAYPWVIPNTPSENCLVRVADTNGSVSDTSDAVFEIDTIPYITITYPNGGDSLYADSSYDITWTTNLTTERIKIEYSTNLGMDWSEIIASKPADTLAYAWIIPNTSSDSCLVRISDSATGFPSDVSDAAFTILPIPYVTVTSPNGGEVWYIDSTYDITWTSEGTSDFLFIDYSIDSGATWLEVTSYVHPDSGSYSWAIPNTPSTNCFVRIGDSLSIDHTPSDTSDAVFEIATTPYITITDPNGGEVWYIDSTYDITWATNLTATEGVIIEYSTNNGTDWSEIITGKPADTLAYAWIIPNTPSDNCLVRITDTTTGSISDTSDAVFTITPASGIPTSEGPNVYSMVVKTITAGNQVEVNYGLPEKANVKFEVYDIKGTKIKEISEEQSSGFYSIQIKMTDKPAGVYFIRMSANAGAFNQISKVVLAR